MPGSDDRIDDVEPTGSETTLRFVLTLIVATLMAASTAYILSYAVLAPGTIGPTHGASASMPHPRS